MAQHCQKMVTFSPSTSSSSSILHKHSQQQQHSHLSFNAHVTGGGAESGYASGFSLSRPSDADAFDVTSRDASLASSHGGEVQTTPRTTAAINFMNALQLSTPRMGLRSSNGRKGTPLKRHQTPSTYNHSIAYETTPKKPKSHENIENETSFLGLSHAGSSMKLPFRARLDRSLSHTMSPLVSVDKLDCTFDAISSSTPIGKPFRAEFYEQHVEEIPVRNLTRSGGKNTRTKIIRKMQSFSPRKLMKMRSGKVPLREMDQNSVDFKRYTAGLFPLEEEESPIPITNSGVVKKALFNEGTGGGGGISGAFSNGLRDLIFGDIKMDAGEREEEPVNEKVEQNASQQSHSQETSSQLLDIYVTNLSNLDGGDSNSKPAMEDGDVSMNNSMVADVEGYFDELKRNTTRVLENGQGTTKDSVNLFENRRSGVNEPVKEMEKDMDVEVPVNVTEDLAQRPRQQPMLLRKRKRPSTELIQGVLATPKKLRRSQSFHVGEQVSDENMERQLEHIEDETFPSHLLVSPPNNQQQRLGGARKRLNYEPLPRNRFSPAKRHLTFDGTARRRSLVGTARLNIFRHLANCPPVRDYFFEFVDDKDLATIYAVSRQCKAIIEEHPKLNARRKTYLESAMRKKENNDYSTNLSSTSSPEDSVLRIQGEKSMRFPLHNRNVDTSTASSVNDTVSPPVSPSRRKFHENQKVVQQNPGAFFVPCPRCRSSSVIERPLLDENSMSRSSHAALSDGDQSFSFRSMRSASMCVSELWSKKTPSLMVRKQMSLPEADELRLAKDNGLAPEQRMGVCQSIQCGFRFCVHCSYAFETGHTCTEIGTLSPLIKQSRQPRVVACSKQSKRNLKRL